MSYNFQQIQMNFSLKKIIKNKLPQIADTIPLKVCMEYTWQGTFRYIESNTGNSARQGNLRHPEGKISIVRWRGCRRFPCLALCAGVWFYFSLLSAVLSLLFDSYVLLADDHANNVSYFPYMSIKKLVPYLCVLREGHYVIIWLIVRIFMFIKDWQHAFAGKTHVIFLSCTSAR